MMHHPNLLPEAELLKDSGRGRRKDVCQKALTALWASDMTIREIAAALRVTDTTIYRRAEEWGLPTRQDPDGRAERNRERRALERAERRAQKAVREQQDRILPVEPPGPPAILSLDDRIRATGGAYAKLEALRLEVGMTGREMTYAWHQARRKTVGTVKR